MQTAEHLDANATTSERDRMFAELLDGPVLDGDVEAWLEALKNGVVAVAQPTPEAVPSQAVPSQAVPSQAVPTENASEFPTSRGSCQPSAGACALSGTLPFLLAAESALNSLSYSRPRMFGPIVQGHFPRL